MKKLSGFLLGTFFGIILTLWISLPNAEGRDQIKGTKAFFAPTGSDRVLHKALTSQIRNTNKTIKIAMFQWTSRDLAGAVINLKKRVKVQVLVDPDQIKNKWSQADELKAAGVEIRYLDLPGEGYSRIKMHHKFAVMDNKIVATGSMNWTVQADEKNYEALLFLTDKKIVNQFTTEFDKMWESGKPWN